MEIKIKPKIENKLDFKEIPVKKFFISDSENLYLKINDEDEFNALMICKFVENITFKGGSKIFQLVKIDNIELTLL